MQTNMAARRWDFFQAKYSNIFKQIHSSVFYSRVSCIGFGKTYRNNDAK